MSDPLRRKVDVVIVGAGFGGMYMLHRLRGLGMSALIFEAASGVGGTWYWNRYPGARCDVESMQYSFSFSPELQQEWQWSELFAAQPEILRYANHVADRFDLRRDIRFETRVTDARFDAAKHRWDIRTDRGDRMSARYCVMATGCLSAARVPDFKGLESFKGDTYHTGHWPHEGVDFTGRRVAVIGTGSSAIQAIPVIAEQAARLFVFQRTPNYSIPSRNGPMTPDYAQRWKSDYPALREKARQARTGILNNLNDTSALAVPDEARQREYEARWATGGTNFMAAFNDLILDRRANDTAAEFVRGKIRADRARSGDRRAAGAERLSDRQQAHLRRHRLFRHLQPGECQPGRRENRADQRDHPERPARRRLRIPGGQHRVRHRFRCDDRRPAEDRHPGQQRQEPAAEMAGGAAHLSRPDDRGFPEPVHDHRARQPLGAQQHDGVDRAACRLDRRLHGTAARARPGLHRADRRSRGCVGRPCRTKWADSTLYPLANSWYMGANIPGKPRVFMPYIGGVGVYRQTCDAVAANGYEGFRLAASSPQSAAAD